LGSQISSSLLSNIIVIPFLKIYIIYKKKMKFFIFSIFFILCGCSTPKNFNIGLDDLKLEDYQSSIDTSFNYLEECIIDFEL
tara:strand:+ start:219 stop:464 length:246 start_codon:yes stop_codon:yes gene_type:complete